MQDGAPVLDTTELLTITTQIVTAHLGHNKVSAEALPALIRSVHQTLAGLGQDLAPDAQPGPAVSAKRSIFPDYLVCLEDGAKVKMLKPYLQRRFGLTPSAYRAKWGLPSNYPMVAPAYAARRSALARQFGLGSNTTGAAISDLDQQTGTDTEADVDLDTEIEDIEADGTVEASPEAVAAPDQPPATETVAGSDGPPTDEPSMEEPSKDEPDTGMDDDSEMKHTVESVFANFGSAGAGTTEGSTPGRQKRKRFSDQMTRQMPARRKSKAP